MKMKLYFENTYGDWRQIGECNSEKEVMGVIKKFLQDHHFKSHYTRTWDEDGWRHYDVGSHTEFFHASLSPNAKVPE